MNWETSRLIGMDALVFNGKTTPVIIREMIGDRIKVEAPECMYIVSGVQPFNPGIPDKLIANKPNTLTETELLLMYTTLTEITDETGRSKIERFFINGEDLFEYDENKKYILNSYIDTTTKKIE